MKDILAPGVCRLRKAKHLPVSKPSRPGRGLRLAGIVGWLTWFRSCVNLVSASGNTEKYSMTRRPVHSTVRDMTDVEQLQVQLQGFLAAVANNCEDGPYPSGS